jgi:hypothetical protein
VRQFILAASLTAMTSALAPAQASNPPCNRRMIVSTDSLRDMAQRLHPESADATKQRAFVTVGLVFDSECRLVHHAVGLRAGQASAEVVLARLIPEATGNTYVTSGFAELPVAARIDSTRPRELRRDGADTGAPWVVWGVQRPPLRR